MCIRFWPALIISKLHTALPAILVITLIIARQYYHWRCATKAQAFIHTHSSTSDHIDSSEAIISLEVCNKSTGFYSSQSPTHSHTPPITAKRFTSRVGQNYIYTVYIRYFWQGNYEIYGHIRFIYTVLANPIYQCSRKWGLLPPASRTAAVNNITEFVRYFQQGNTSMHDHIPWVYSTLASFIL